MKNIIPQTAQEIAVHFLKLDGWEIVIWESDKVCMVLRGNQRIRTRYCEVSNDGTVTHLKGAR
jgi:hypothetical protein